MNLKTISILGATGSIGCSTIAIIREINKKPNSDVKYELKAITANNNVDDLIKIAIEFKPEFVAIADEEKYSDLKSALSPLGIKCGAGKGALLEAASIQSDMVMAAIVGFAGLMPTIKAVERGATILLANKECLVSAGDYFMQKAAQNAATILPVDSEHNAIFQVLNKKNVEKLILTASGGPFYNSTPEVIQNATPEQACKHPNWSMGQKISVDSATMMNKGLELIEACHLFKMPATKIDILIHPQSIVHSMVCYEDGSVLAQMGTPDMRIPISYCMAYPERINISTPRLSLADAPDLQFLMPDTQKFPALRIARDAAEQGGLASTLLNAANEVAVESFLNRKIKFFEIAAIVEDVLNSKFNFSSIDRADDYELIIDCDDAARRKALEFVAMRQMETGVVR